MDPADATTGPLRKSAKAFPTLRGVLTPLDSCLLFRDAEILCVGDHQDPTVIGRRIGHRIAPVRIIRVLLNERLSSVTTVVVGEESVGRVHWLVATERIIP